MSRIGTAWWQGVRQFRRTPVVLALLVVLPAYAIEVFALAAPEVPAVVYLPDGASVRVGLGAAFPAFLTPMVAALLTGIAGLFLMQQSAAADGRLVVAGYRAREVILARLGLLVGVAAVGTLVSAAVMLLEFDPAHLGWFLVAIALAALIYGLIGVLAGLLLDSLPGVYLIMFGAMLDLFLFQNPLSADPPALAPFLPGHYPMNLAIAAGFGDGLEPAALAGAIGVLALLTVAATLTFYHTTRIAT